MPRKILVAEDSRVARKILKNILESEGDYQVILAEDGQDAWDRLSRPTQVYDACISDLIMPNLDGFGLIERIRQTLWLREMPVLLCTAVKDRNALQRALALSIRHYILKPYSAKDVLAKIHKACRPAGNTNVPFPGGLTTPPILPRQESKPTIQSRAAAFPFGESSLLGIAPTTHGDFLGELIEDVKKWLFKAANPSEKETILSLATEANSFRGACLILEMSSLAAQFYAVERQLVPLIGHPVADVRPSLASLFDQISNEINKVYVGISSVVSDSDAVSA